MPSLEKIGHCGRLSIQSLPRPTRTSLFWPFSSQSFSSQGKALSQRPTLAMKSQKPCSERWPLTAPLTQPRAALPTQPANRRRLFLCSYEGAARGESTKQRGQRARLPQSKAPAVAAAPSSAFKRRMYLQLPAMKSLQPWPSLWPNAACSKSLQPSAPRRSLQASSRAASRLRAKTPSRQSSAVKLWAQAGAAATFTSVSATQLDPAAALD